MISIGQNGFLVISDHPDDVRKKLFANNTPIYPLL